MFRKKCLTLRKICKILNIINVVVMCIIYYIVYICIFLIKILFRIYIQIKISKKFAIAHLIFKKKKICIQKKSDKKGHISQYLPKSAYIPINCYILYIIQITGISRTIERKKLFNQNGLYFSILIMVNVTCENKLYYEIVNTFTYYIFFL